MNKYGQRLLAPVTQTLIPAMNESGLMYGFYIINTTVFTGSETSLTLIDTVVPLTTVTLDYNPTDTTRVTQYMAAVFSKNTPMNSQPWSSSALIPAGSGLSREWLLAAQGYGARSTQGVLLTAIHSTMAPNLGPAPSAVVPPNPLVNTPMQWSVSINNTMMQALPNGGAFFDINWMGTFNTQSPVKGNSIAVLTNPSSGFRVGVIGTPVNAPSNPADPNSFQAMVYETLRFIYTTATAGDYVFTFRVTCADGSTTDIQLTLTLVGGGG